MVFISKSRSGGDHQLASIGVRIFAGTYGGGVFLSTNSGSQWGTANEGLSFLNVNALAVSQENLFAGTTGGLWKRPLSQMSTPLIAALSLNRTAIAFPSTKLSQWRDTTVTVTNTGTDTLRITSITSATAYFTARPTALTVPPGQIKIDTIRFQPDAARQFKDTLYLHNNSPVSLVKLPLSGNGISTSVEQSGKDIPNAFALCQNYPNPFNPSTNFEFRIAEFGFVSVKVFDLLGHEVATLVNEMKHAGSYTVKWDASLLSSGVYFYTLRTGQFRETKRMILMK